MSSPSFIAPSTGRGRKPHDFGALVDLFDGARRMGNEYRVHCPAHDDGRPSLALSYNASTRNALLKCRSNECPAETIAAAVGLTLADLCDLDQGQAVALASTSRGRSGRRSIGVRVDDSDDDTERVGLTAALTTYARAAARRFPGSTAATYAAERFGVDAATAERLGLGYDDGTVVEPPRVSISWRKNRLTIPFRSAAGTTIGLQARDLDPEGPKDRRWMGPKTVDPWSWAPWGLLRASGADDGPVVVTEGPSDALTIAGAGLDALLVAGAGRPTEAGGPELLDDLAAALDGREVLVAGDNDAAGRRFTAAVVRGLAERGVTVRPMAPGAEADVNAWRMTDPEGFRHALRIAVREALASPLVLPDEPERLDLDAGEDDGPAPSGDRGKALDVDGLVTFVLDRYRPIRSQDGGTFVVTRDPDAARLAVPVASIGARMKVDIRETGGRSPSREAVAAALDLVEAYAVSATPETVYLRAANLDGCVWLDLGDSEGRMVRATADGWAVVVGHPSAPIFRRPGVEMPLPVPGRSNPDALRVLLDLEPDDERWLLIRGWLAVALFPSVPRPVLWTLGQSGTGKSTRTRYILSALDPVPELGEALGKNHRQDSTRAQNRYIPSWDNVGSLSSDTSNWLCRLVTGVANEERTLYTNGGLTVSSYKRAAVASSLSMPPGLAADALSRILLVEFDPLRGRRRELAVLDQSFTDAHPGILAAVLDDVVAVLRGLQTVSPWTGGPLPRLMDYAVSLAALDLVRGTETHRAYVEADHRRQRDAAEDDPFTSAVLAVVRNRGTRWSGTVAELLSAINPYAPMRLPDWWPESAPSLGRQLVKLAGPLEAAGLTVAQKKTKRGSWFDVTLREDPSDADEDVATPLDLG